MKISNFHIRGRRAISPIVATVLIVAVTLVASVAIAGFVFGIFSTQSNAAQVSVTSQALIAADLTAGAAAADTCAVISGVSQITLSNTGTGSASATSVTITYAGTTTSFTITAPCTVTAAGFAGATTAGNPINIIFGAVNHLTTTGAAPGGVYSGTVTMSNGAVLLFTGTFQ